MNKGDLAFLRNRTSIKFDWYYLFCENPVEKDVVVILGVTTLYEGGHVVYFISLLTGTEDWMRKEDFKDCFIINGEE